MHYLKGSAKLVLAVAIAACIAYAFMEYGAVTAAGGTTLDGNYGTIYATQAEHLDSNKAFVEDVFGFVKAQDNSWTTIPDGDFVRVAFEKNLTNKKDISIYARGNNSQIEVYRQDDGSLVARSDSISGEGWHKIYLTSLAENESYPAFDLKSLGPVDYDYVVDPDNWWNSSWVCRKSFNVTENSGVNLSDFQVNISVDTQTPISQGKMNADCSDIRFVNSSNDPVSYWLNNSCNSLAGVVWIKVNNLTASQNSTFYMYYGNPSATSQSNGTATFDFFEDFSGDLSKWSKEKNPANLNIVNGYLNISGGITSGAYGHSSLGSNVTYNSFVNGTIEGVVNLTTNSIAEVAYRGGYVANTGYKSRMDARSNQGISNLKPPYLTWATLGTASGTACATNTWLPFSITANGTTLTIKACGQTKITTDTSYSSAGEISLQNHYGPFSLYDNITVRKFASVSPTAIFANEEISDTAPPNVWLYSPNASYYNTTTLNLLYSASDIILDKVWYNYTSGNVTVTSNGTITGVEGSNNLTLWANDTSNNQNSTVPFTVNIDTQPANTTIDNTSGSTFINPTSISIQGTCADQGMAGLHYAYTNSNHFTEVIPLSGASGIFNLTNTSSLAYKNYDVYVFCNDSYGNNLNFSKITFTISSGGGSCTPPAVNSDWNLLCSDICQITSEVNLGTGNLVISGSGDTYLAADIYASGIRWIQPVADSCRVHNFDRIVIQ